MKLPVTHPPHEVPLDIDGGRGVLFNPLEFGQREIHGELLHHLGVETSL